MISNLICVRTAMTKASTTTMVENDDDDGWMAGMQIVWRI